MENPISDTRIPLLDAAAIREELAKIVESRLFSTTPILRHFLHFVVEHTIAGKENELKEYTIALAVLGKRPDFDPGKDASVRIHAIRLRKMLDKYYKSTENSIKYRIHIPTGSYKPVFIPFGPVRPVAVSSLSFVPVMEKQKAPRAEDDLLCLLPFTSNLQGDYPELSLEKPYQILHHKLSLFQDIAVLPIADILKFLKKGGEVQNLSKSLGVKYYLSGDIDINGNTIFILVSLFIADSNEFMGSLSFNEEITEGSLDAAVENITTRIASSLADYSGLIHIKMLASSSGLRDYNIISHGIYWYYKFITNNRKDIFHESLVQLEEAVKLCPQVALPWGLLGHLLTKGLIYNYLPFEGTREKAIYAAGRAIEINPDSQQGHLTMGWILIFYGEKDKAISCFKKVISINPYSSYFKSMAGMGFAMAGEYKSGLVLMEDAQKSNPIPSWWVNLPYIFIALRNQDFEKVLYYSKKVTIPSVVFEHIFEMIALFYLGKNHSLIKLIKEYNVAHPGGLEFVSKVFQFISLDKDLSGQLSRALNGIHNLYSNQVNNPDAVSLVYNKL